MENIKQRKSRLAVFEHVPHKEKEKLSHRYTRRYNGLKRSRTPSDSELVIDDDEDNVMVAPKRRRQGVRLTQEVLKLRCNWSNCSQIFNDYKKFIEHITAHDIEENIKSDSFECLWDCCSYVSASKKTLIQHIYYHGYHTKLKNIGMNVLERTKLPKCNQMEEFSLPDVSSGFVCSWEYCNIYFENVYNFLEHLKIHINNNPKYCKQNEIIECGWKGCSSKFPSQYKLCDHVRSHTKEKVLACPTCGNMFSNKTKFYDHRKRQLSIEMQSYQCSQCIKLFASERLLRDHMSMHINHYKCSMCDMTCTKPANLALHIRYRHLPDRPFKCHLCERSCVTKYDLEIHLLTHTKGHLFYCEICNFSCSDNTALERHIQNKHGEGFTPLYACHCCEKRFCRGGGLTKHLINVHDFHWPSGHSRFRYKADPEDGVYRLQTVRYESIEVTQEMITNNIQYQPSATNQKYALRKIHDETEDAVPSFCISVVEEDAATAKTAAEEQGSNVVSEENERAFSVVEQSHLKLNVLEKAGPANEIVELDSILKIEEVNLLDSKAKLEDVAKAGKVVLQTDNNIYITIENMDDKGNIVSREVMETNEFLIANNENTPTK